MKKPEQKIGKITIGFAMICLLAAVLILGIRTLQDDSETGDFSSGGLLIAATTGFDAEGAQHQETYRSLPDAYINSSSTSRTLEEYYSRRQYPGSPPSIPHPINDGFGKEENCLSCHESGGYTQKWQRNVPLTPHPEKEMCRQCHVVQESKELFVAHDWRSVSPPRLGGSHLPGAPPPFPHSLQMRENCAACHIGPGAVTEIRVEHASRGACRQCHLPEVTSIEPFERASR